MSSEKVIEAARASLDAQEVARFKTAVYASAVGDAVSDPTTVMALAAAASAIEKVRTTTGLLQAKAEADAAHAAHTRANKNLCGAFNAFVDEAGGDEKGMSTALEGVGAVVVSRGKKATTTLTVDPTASEMVPEKRRSSGAGAGAGAGTGAEAEDEDEDTGAPPSKKKRRIGAHDGHTQPEVTDVKVCVSAVPIKSYSKGTIHSTVPRVVDRWVEGTLIPNLATTWRKNGIPEDSEIAEHDLSGVPSFTSRLVQTGLEAELSTVEASVSNPKAVATAPPKKSLLVGAVTTWTTATMKDQIEAAAAESRDALNAQLPPSVGRVTK